MDESVTISVTATNRMLSIVTMSMVNVTASQAGQVQSIAPTIITDVYLFFLSAYYPTGLNCSDPCPPNTWGQNCVEQCQCPSRAVCDQVTGSCDCVPGYTGKSCSERKTIVLHM